MRNNALRSWWKPWTWSTRTWVAAIMLSAIISPIVTRWICLSQVPDVQLPFALDDAKPSDESTGENAFAVYEDIVKMIASNRAKAAKQTLEKGGVGSEVSEEEILKRLFAHDEEALAAYIRAGKIERTGGPSVKTMTFWTNLDLHQQLRQVVTNYSALGITLADGGDLEKAWTCHLANLQCSIHAEQPCVAICVLVAVSLRSTAADGMVHWASNPSLSAERLRAARADIAREYARRVPISSAHMGDYFALRNTLERAESADFLLPNPGQAPSSKPLLVAKRVLLWSMGQPEMALRTNRQILTNLATEIDKPLHSRCPATELTGPLIFDLDPQVRRASGQLEPQQLVRILESNAPIHYMNKAVVPAMKHFDRALHRDNARLAALMVLFAAQEFQRVQGTFPESINQLVPAYLDEVPYDPMDPKAAPMFYRREADGTAIVWSIGLNGVDDHGSIDGKDFLDTGYRIRVNRPSSESTQEIEPK